VEYNRLRWASRRGMLELDLILMPFVEGAYPKLDAAEQADYARLLESEDQDLFAWFLHRQEPDDETLRLIVAKVRSYALERPLS
jgi:antitoxin CptB